MASTQIRREISVLCALGVDVLLLGRLCGSEGLSTLSEYTLDLYSERDDLLPDDLLATPATVTLNQSRGGQRYFSGIITRFALTGRRGRHATYQATMRPWLWFLTGNLDSRIFQEKSVLEIITAVFAPYAIADVDTSRLRGSYGTYPYCVQYHETDFNFVSRLLENEGIYYYFKNTAGRHTMVLADSYAAHDAASGYASMLYMPAPPLAMRGSEVVHEWSMHGEIEPVVQPTHNFDVDKPSENMMVSSAEVCANAHHELSDYRGDSAACRNNDAHAVAGRNVGHTRYQRVRGKTSARGLFPGCLFKLTEHPRGDQNCEFMMMAADYTLSSDTYEPTQIADPLSLLTCTFTAIAKHQKYQPARLARKPVALGPLTAIVAGEVGEKVQTDKLGRIQVQFRWDSTGRRAESSACWVRVATGWASLLGDSILAPRGGQEVILSFVEGDPDRPLVIGSFYNAC